MSRRLWPSECCPRCGGDCEIETGHTRLDRTTGAFEIETVRCEMCGGTGEIEGELVLAAPYGMAEEDAFKQGEKECLNEQSW